MRRVINGKVYDTRTAKEVGSADSLGRSASSVTDFQYWEATLYQTKKGRFFLAGEGGPMTMFSEPAGQNASIGGSGIIPMSREETLEWAESHLDPEVIETFFGDDLEEA